ncbi:MAG: DUF3352 domain-containing protein [Planctomycetaceae bacterium]|nr:DUF3352 domain-containing protein [Planctomycetaceae bacterium]
MSISRFFTVSALLAIFTATTLCCASLYAASTPADKIFPDTTKGFVSIRNLSEFGEQWRQTQFGQLMENPMMDDFKQEVQKQLTDRMQKTFGLTLDDISSLPSGEVAFGMIAVPNQIPGYVLTMDVAGKRAETDRYLADLTQKLVGAGAIRTTETYRDQQITILTFPPGEARPPRPLGGTRIEIAIEPIERKAYYMFFQDTLIASDQLHLLKLLADRVAGQSGRSLADVEAYQVTMKRCIDDMPVGMQPIVRWFIDPLDYGESIRVLLRGPVAQNRREKPSVFSILKEQGFDALQGVGGVVTVKTEAQESVSRTFIYTKKPYRLAMQMLNFPDNVNFAPPAWMPHDLARCTMVYVDPVAIFDNFGVLFDAFVMPGEEGVWRDILDGLERDPHGPQINIREEIIVHLGTQVLGMSRYEKPITATSESIVIAAELKPNAETAMKAGMEKLFGTDPEMTSTMHNSYKIWHRKPVEEFAMDMFGVEIPGMIDVPDVNTVPVAVRNPMDDQDADRPPVFPEGGVVVAKNALFVATNIDYLKVVLDRLDAPNPPTIGGEAEYQAVKNVFAAMGLTNKPHFFQFFARTHETLRPTYEMVRRGQMAQSQAVMGKLLNVLLSSEGEVESREQIFDGSKLPDFDAIQHYFGKVGIYGASEENGYFIKGFTIER